VRRLAFLLVYGEVRLLEKGEARQLAMGDPRLLAVLTTGLKREEMMSPGPARSSLTVKENLVSSLVWVQSRRPPMTRTMLKAVCRPDPVLASDCAVKQ
jgi:hypothetical protein